MIILVVDGKAYEQFTEASVSFSMDSFARQFRFLATGSGGNPLPFKGGESCSIYIDDVSSKNRVLEGFIDIIDISYDARSHSIEISGRGRAADIADSTIDVLELNSEISLEDVISAVISQFGSNVNVVNLVSDLELFNSSEDQLGATGKNGFEFIEELARKRQVILNENGDGDIEITRAQTNKYSQKLQNLIYSDANNIKDATITYDLTGIYKTYIARSSQNTTALSNSGSLDLAQVVDQSGRSISESSRDGRQFAFISEKASSNDQLVDRVNWESNIRRARSRVYNVTFVGHKTNFDENWVINKLISVNDEFAGISEDMLINSVTLSETLQGEIVKLGLIDKDAYTPNPADSLSDNVGSEFVFGGG